MKLQERLRELLAKTTPGPWKVDDDLRQGMEWNRHIVDFSGDNRICFMSNTGERPEGFANAKLIALAPTIAAQLDLYEAALREARLQLLYVDERWPTGTTPAAVAKIDAALNSTDTGA